MNLVKILKKRGITYGYLPSGFVLSSTILNRDNCLYARKTLNAIIRKSNMFGIKSQYLNSDVELGTIFVTLSL
jgi:hypothetical protein